MLRYFATFCVVFVSVFALGCGSKGIRTDVVTGKVTFNGEPFEGAAVRFSPVADGAGNIAYGSTDKDGVYKLQTLLGDPDAGTTPGEYVVTVSKGFSVGTGRFETTPEGERYEIMEPLEMVPAVYSDKTKSQLRFTVVAGKKNEYPITLEGKLRTTK